MVSQKQYNALKKASDSYLSQENFGIRDIEDIMSDVFGSERAGDEAVSWARYWNDLNMYEEHLRDTACTGGTRNAPMVRRTLAEAQI